ncbi:hypothetical protein PS421_09075 [Pediococcus pentosaceus]|uniref:hypothetical protein n=1 Tax=Pediococcus pentosaceus TaxID=1255 RepID=UPI002F265810
MIKKVLKEIWNIRWVIITLFTLISFITSTIQDFINKDYDSGFGNLMIVLLIIDIFLLLWSRAKAEKLINLQDEIIAKQSKLINQVIKVVKENTKKDKTNKESAEKSEAK